MRLYETVKRIRDLSDPTMYAQLNRILNDIDRERVYFEKMADALEDIELKALQISSKISSKIESDAERAESVINKSLML